MDTKGSDSQTRDRADEANRAKKEQANVGKHHRVWDSEAAFVVSTAAAAVGLGNLWRFPYLVGEQGGGAFLLAYLLCLIFVALPIAIIELAAGRRTRTGMIGAFRRAGKRSGYFGFLVLLLIFLITSYYLVLTGWTLSYTLDATDGTFSDFSSYRDGYGSLWSFLAVAGLAAIPLLMGVGAIEKVAFVTTPVLFLFLAGLGTYGASRGEGWSQSVDFLTGFDAADLMRPTLWYTALGQSFYSLMIGQGYLLTYGRHVSSGTNLPRAASVIAAINATAGIGAGFVIFPFVFASGADVAQGPQLVFAVLPEALSDIPLGNFLGIAFFLTFLLAAFSSCVASLKTIADGFIGIRAVPYRRAVGIVVIALLAAGLPSALSYTALDLQLAGAPVLDRIDDLTGTALVIAIGAVGAVLLSRAARHRRPPD